MCPDDNALIFCTKEKNIAIETSISKTNNNSMTKPIIATNKSQDIMVD